MTATPTRSPRGRGSAERRRQRRDVERGYRPVPYDNNEGRPFVRLCDAGAPAFVTAGFRADLQAATDGARRSAEYRSRHEGSRTNRPHAAGLSPLTVEDGHARAEQIRRELASRG